MPSVPPPVALACLAACGLRPQRLGGQGRCRTVAVVAGLNYPGSPLVGIVRLRRLPQGLTLGAAVPARSSHLFGQRVGRFDGDLDGSDGERGLGAAGGPVEEDLAGW